MASRFVYILTRGKSNTLAPEDFVPLVQDVVDTHPGLSFLKEATEFHSRYVHTVSKVTKPLVIFLAFSDHCWATDNLKQTHAEKLIMSTDY